MKNKRKNSPNYRKTGKIITGILAACVLLSTAVSAASAEVSEPAEYAASAYGTAGPSAEIPEEADYGTAGSGTEEQDTEIPESIERIADNVIYENGVYRFDYEEEITENGYIYAYAGYELFETCNRLTYEVESEELFEGEDADFGFEETVSVDGTVYELEKTESAGYVKTGRTAEVTCIRTRNLTLEGEAEKEIPAVSYTDPDTGIEKEFEENSVNRLVLTDSILIYEGWNIGAYRSDLTFFHYDYTAFEYMDRIFVRDTEKPLPEDAYQSVLADQQLDSSLFRVTDISWNGPEYTENGIEMRDAVITGDVYDQYFEDTYSAVLNIPDISYNINIAVYKECEEDFAKRGGLSAKINYRITNAVEEELSGLQQTGVSDYASAGPQASAGLQTSADSQTSAGPQSSADLRTSAGSQDSAGSQTSAVAQTSAGPIIIILILLAAAAVPAVLFHKKKNEPAVTPEH